MTTTGFRPWILRVASLAQTLLIILMFIGACAGSTSGGLKVSRIVIYFKMILKEIKYSIHPHQVTIVLFEREPLDESVQKGVAHHFIAYLFILVLGNCSFPLMVFPLRPISPPSSPP